MKHLFQKSNGFTLVELAIVLMIIGLLIGGVLRGQEMYNNARISRTIQDVKAYTAAVVGFRDVYYNNPGDMVLATSKIPGCTAAKFCLNGNGNTIIGNRYNMNDMTVSQTGTATPGYETTQFWKHIALAHLITGVNPSSDPASPAFGKTHPASAMGGGWAVAYGSHIPGVTIDSISLVLTNTLIVGQNMFNPGYNVLSPVQARQIDSKMDDGLGDAGDVSAPDNGTCDQNNQYLNTELKNCTLVFRLL